MPARPKDRRPGGRPDDRRGGWQSDGPRRPGGGQRPGGQRHGGPGGPRPGGPGGYRGAGGPPRFDGPRADAPGDRIDGRFGDGAQGGRSQSDGEHQGLGFRAGTGREHDGPPAFRRSAGAGPGVLRQGGGYGRPSGPRPGPYQRPGANRPGQFERPGPPPRFERPAQFDRQTPPPPPRFERPDQFERPTQIDRPAQFDRQAPPPPPRFARPAPPPPPFRDAFRAPESTYDPPESRFRAPDVRARFDERHGASEGGPPPAAAPRPAFAARPFPPRPGAAGPHGPASPVRPGIRPYGAAPARPWSASPRDFAAPPRPEPDLTLADDEELLAGRHPVEEAFVAGRPARRLLVVPQRRDALERLVLHATALRLPIIEVEGGTLTSIAGFDGHQGIAVVVEARRSAEPAEILARAIERDEPAFVVALDSLEDPQNLGTLLRSSEAAGVHGVIYPTRRQAPLSPAAVKASSGASEHLLLAPVDDLPGALSDLHLRGLRVVGADADAPMAYRDADLRGPLVLVVGSEGRGLAPAVRRRCDLLVRIPMRGHVASLNAAVAGSILVFEAASQRGLPEGPPPAPARLRLPEPAAPAPAPAPDPIEPEAIEIVEPEAIEVPEPVEAEAVVEGGTDVQAAGAESVPDDDLLPDAPSAHPA